jgi:plasmid maintenance system antidote protein VapI
MIGLEYILNLYDMQHQTIAEKLGIKKQNINLWVKEKQSIPKKYLPVLSSMFGIVEEYFQKELTEVERLILQKEKLQKDLEPVIVGYQQQLSFENEDEPDLIEIPIYDTHEMNEIDFQIEKAKVLNSFREILTTVKNDVDLSSFQQLALLFNNHGEEVILRATIDALSHYYDVLPDWVGEPESDEFVEEFIHLAKGYEPIIKENIEELNELFNRRKE